ncbi:hypothetical protein [uncultured Ilyobacter sp.]|uniref:hypothetical protein n=1 Tax=uncultured Ilyobacter sp. TaxID=544433 RepID=UPI0029F479ED|nr:hypothetical protein [uncultured Ilyobacter sp.]
MSKKESFFGNIFKKRRNDIESSEIDILNSIIEERNQIINQMKEELIEEKKKVGIDLKQLEIYEKNLKNKDKKNLELSNHIRDLKNSKAAVEKNLENLKNSHEKSTLEINLLREENQEIKTKYLQLSETYRLIEGENQNLKLSKEEVKNQLEDKINRLNELKNEGNQMQILGDSFISKDELEEMRLKIDSLNRLCGEQREKINSLESELSHKESMVDDFRERLAKALSPKSDEIRYKLPVEELFSASKFSEIKTALVEMKFSLVRELKEKSLVEILGDGIKNIETASKILEDYFSGKTSWEIKIYLYKGDKLSKIFSRQRKLINYFNDNYMEFASDLDNFDFDILLQEGFSDSHVEKFKDILEEYNKQRRV